MGISVYDAAMLAGVAARQARRERIVALGMPKINFTPHKLARWCRRLGVQWTPPAGLAAEEPIPPAQFFASLGYQEFLALDVSDYEGAQIVHDLNDPNLPEVHQGLADCVVDAGTLEHVFNVPAALRTVGALLRPGGLAVHLTPCNGYLDHGFYQICPTLFYDYYSANAYRVVSASIVNRFGGILSDPYVQDVYRRPGGSKYGIERMRQATLFFAAEKTPASTDGVVPTQSYYRQMHSGEAQRYATDLQFRFDFKPSALKRLAGRAVRRLRHLGNA